MQRCIMPQMEMWVAPFLEQLPHSLQAIMSAQKRSSIKDFVKWEACLHGQKEGFTYDPRVISQARPFGQTVGLVLKTSLARAVYTQKLETRACCSALGIAGCMRVPK